MNNVCRYQLALEKFWHILADHNTGVSVKVLRELSRHSGKK
jgi:hypothetical protein